MCFGLTTFGQQGQFCRMQIILVYAQMLEAICVIGLPLGQID
jgi:hypothetical protein